MAFQFVHLEMFSRKADVAGRSTSWVLAEAERQPAACPHVARPEPPQAVYGVDVAEVRRRHDVACETARVTLANGKSRAVRKDQKSLGTIVASHPATMERVRSDPVIAADVARWESLTVAWLREQYGDRLLSVIRHTDESHPHLHAYVLPEDLRATRLHPGHEAKRSVIDAGPREEEDSKALNRRGDEAYRQAMRSWQDSYWVKVGLPCGLTRLGPGRRRLSRAEWQAEKSATAAVKIAEERAAAVNRQTRAFVTDTKAKGAAYAERVHAEAASATAVAVAQAEAAKRLHDAAEAKERKSRDLLSRARSEASRILAAAETSADRLRSFGGRLRSLLDGLRRSSIWEAARRDAAETVTCERARAEEASQRAIEETRRRREAERRASEAAAAAHLVGMERDHARRQLAALRPDLGPNPSPAPR